jgi:hypothetical protein
MIEPGLAIVLILGLGWIVSVNRTARFISWLYDLKGLV